jgi:hypothetical protein
MSTVVTKIEETMTRVSTQVNRALREFFHNSKAEQIIVYFTKTELPTLQESDIQKLIDAYTDFYHKTHLPMFVNRLLSKQILDCGNNTLLSAGSFPEQKINLLFLQKNAIKAIGYFDERYTDSCAFGDYAHRLSTVNLYPKLTKKHLPWLFDINHSQQTTKSILDELSSGWYNYKYEQFPQNLTYENFEELKKSLKEYILSNKK